MPASRPRNAKPVEMRRTLRLCTVFDHSQAMIATTMATTTICQNNPEKFLSFSEIRIRREGARAGFSVVTAQASSADGDDWRRAKSRPVFHMLQFGSTYETNVSWSPNHRP